MEAAARNLFKQEMIYITYHQTIRNLGGIPI
jgi:hypothetical protein